MKELQRIVNLLNQRDLKYDKQSLEVVLSQSGKRVKIELVLTAGGNSRRNVISTLNYDQDEYEYGEAIQLIEKMGIEYLCILGLGIVSERGKTIAV